MSLLLYNCICFMQYLQDDIYTYIGYKKCVCNTNNALCLQGKNCTATPGLSFYIGLPVIWETCLPGNLSNGLPVYWVTCLQGNRPQGKLSVLYSTVYRVTCLQGNLSKSILLANYLAKEVPWTPLEAAQVLV